jgi:hypothetical protein
MKDEQEETPLNREARKREWKAVEELLVRGADPNLLDKDGCSVMNRAICCEQQGAVKLLIEYLANIHTAAELDDEFSFNDSKASSVYSNIHTPAEHDDKFCFDTRMLDKLKAYAEAKKNGNKASSVSANNYFTVRYTPLQLLINKRQGELIHHTLMWCPDQAKGVNDKGESSARHCFGQESRNAVPSGGQGSEPSHTDKRN